MFIVCTSFQIVIYAPHFSSYPLIILLSINNKSFQNKILFRPTFILLKEETDDTTEGSHDFLSQVI